MCVKWVRREPHGESPLVYEEVTPVSSRVHPTDQIQSDKLIDRLGLQIIMEP